MVRMLTMLLALGASLKHVNRYASAIVMEVFEAGDRATGSWYWHRTIAK